MSSGSKRPSLTLTHSPTPGQLSTQRVKCSESKDDNDNKDGMGEKLAKIFPLIRIVQVQVGYTNYIFIWHRFSDYLNM